MAKTKTRKTKKKAVKSTAAPAVPQEKIKVLAYCDSPTCATGFGTVSRNILSGLFNTGRYSIDILGINYWGDPHGFPFRIWPTGTNAEKDPYGRKKVFNMIPRMEYDILFFLQDSFILDFLPQIHEHLRGPAGKDFRSICYFPVDGTPKEEWMKNVNACDYPVAYSQFGKEEAEKAYSEMKELEVIPHGANVSDYFVIDEKDRMAFRAQYFGSQADKFIFTNLNRNQQRKDIPRTIAAFAKFREEVPEALLYLHMARQDQGWNLDEVIKSYGLSMSEDVIFPQNFGPNQGYPRNIVNMIYNISDCVISTTLGEGWGLSWTEAMATKTPVIMPANTALVETITEDKGFLVKSGGDASLYTVLPHDNEVIRPLVDVNDMVDKMLQVYHDREEAKRRAENAYAWVVNDLNWQDAVVPKWVEVFDKAYEDLKAGKPVQEEVEAPAETIEAETF
jgi:glycosyltransferase involved in cell wall biosynthesis